jgi:hypothetical protein
VAYMKVLSWNMEHNCRTLVGIKIPPPNIPKRYSLNTSLESYCYTNVLVPQNSVSQEHIIKNSSPESESYVMTDGQPASLFWNKAPIWGLRPDFNYCLTVTGLLIWGALS